MTAYDTGRTPRFAMHERRRVVGPFGLLSLTLVLCVGGGTQAQGQVWGPFAPSPIFQYGGYGVPWALPPVNFGTFYPGVVDFGVMNWYPATGYNDYYAYNPYWYYQQWAAADTLAIADYGINQAAYNVKSMNADTMSGANSLVANQLAELAALDSSHKPNHGERYDVVTGRPWSVGRAGNRRLIDLTSQAGDVLWPLTAPSDGDLRDKRRAADGAIRAAVTEFRGAGKSSVEKVSHAIQSLAAYASPAVDELRTHDPASASGFTAFVRDLDTALRGLVGEVDAAKLPRPKPQARPATRPRG